MLTLLEGGFGSVCHRELTERIKASVDKKRRCFLFVPEQQTLSCEAEMCAMLPPYAPQIFEVTNFTRFANTAFRNLGGIGGSYCSGAESSLIMWRVLNELCDRLSMTGGRRPVSSGTVERALSAVREMQGHGISPELVEAARLSEKITDARLRSKLSDLSMIYGTYREYVSEKYNDLAEDAAELAKRLEENPEYLFGVDIYVDGFISFTEPQYKLLSVMMRSTELTVTLTLPRARRDAFEYSEVKAAEERLKQIAREAGVDIRVTKKDERDPSFCPALSRVCDLLFSTVGKIDNESLQELKNKGGRVRIFEARDPFEECDFVAADIKRRVMAGESYSSFAIIARNAKKYVGVLDEALSRASIPHFISKKRDITSFEAIKLISVAYQIILRGFRREDVLTYAKCGLAGITQEACDELELYTTAWSIEGDGFTRDEGWRMNPRGYEALTEEDMLRLSAIEETRCKITEPLLRFGAETKRASTVRAHAEVLFNFLDEIELEKKLYERAKELLSLGEVESAEENARLWQTVCDSLDTLVGVLGEARIDAESFIGLLGVVFKEAGISRLPLSRDQVTVGSADTLRMRDKRHVYLIGVNAGEFPQNITDVSFFTERDRNALCELDLPIKPELDIRSARELYCFARAFSAAKETVTLLFTSLSASMEAILPSDVIARIAEISTVSEENARRVHIPVQRLEDMHTVDRIYSPNDALMLASRLNGEEYSEVKTALFEAGLSDIVGIAEGNPINDGLKLSKELAAVIYNGDIYISQSRLDKFQSCPFSYHARYVFGLNENGRSELSANVIGNFIHKVLEGFFTEVKQIGGKIGSLTPEEREKIAARAAESYVNLVLGDGFGSARKQNAIAQLRRAARPVVECISREFESCEYEPRFVELSTYGTNPKSPDPAVYKIDGSTTAHVSGFVDRVDTLKVGSDVYVRVIDYKSGAKTFDSRELAEGKNLQMFLYLKSIVDTKKPEFLEEMGVEEGGRLIPAGVIYVKTSMKDKLLDDPFTDDTESVISALNEREGMLLDDEVSIGAMSQDHLPKGAEEDGGKNRYTEDGWQELCDVIEESVVRIVGGMKKGDARAEPSVKGRYGPCSYCPYKAICRNPKI
ncbi:MAG: PD-(D/E)XK nuclease family protein [Clostridia bacterium]|nr:PD-(D/E)XK nuclease family protein [Clostridia bacterium]